MPVKPFSSRPDSPAACVPPLGQTLRFVQRDWLSSNSVVLLDDAETASVIDSGYVLHARDTVKRVGSALEGRRLTRILNTHLHSDHCGGNAELQAVHGGPDTCAILVPAGELDAVDAWDENALSYRGTGQRVQPFAAQGSIASGDVLRLGSMEWRVIAAPGHDAHALMLFQPDARVLVSGDAIWERGFGVIFPELVGEPGFEAQRATLDRIEALNPAWILPGHGAAFTDAAAALARARQRLSTFAADPAGHAGHGLRVLLKFQLLQHPDGIDVDALRGWFEAAPLVMRAVALFWRPEAMSEVFEATLQSLIAAGAAAQTQGRVVDAAPAGR